jgi:FK506-binding nuclear protein
LTQASLNSSNDDNSLTKLYCSSGSGNGKFVVCNLRNPECANASLNFVFSSASSTTFEVSGSAAVDVTGFTEDVTASNTVPATVADSNSEQALSGQKRKLELQASQNKEIANKKRLAEAEEEDDNDEEEDDDDDEEEEDDEKEREQESKKVDVKNGKKQQIAKSEANQPKAANTKADDKVKVAEKEQPKEKIQKEVKHTPVTLANGLKYLDSKIGNGAQVKSGRQLSMRYKGMLTSGKVFDSNMPKGRPFTFTLGAGEVIKGWDIGIQGMKIGGTRRLVIPSELAYGRRGAPPDIPPNAQLVFDVELLSMR